MLFTDRGKRRVRGAREPIDVFIDKIEAFAPKKHRSDREVYYYNYRILHIYSAPLMALLEVISENGPMIEEPAPLAGTLFEKLKGFYDPMERLTLLEAKADRNLKKKLMEIFRYFYGRTDISGQDIECWLEKNP